ncbi:MAG: LTA synthase family protein, partial [Bacteroidaceae bacterium]|nr:LTA synthase family protein [Bacteroidaceae bacterium]
MNAKQSTRNALALLANLLVAYVACTICRLAFLAVNSSMFADASFARIGYLLSVGLIFDSPAVLYSNIVVMVCFLFPLHYKERRGFYVFVKWLYVVINALCAAINLCDAVYFPFSGKRTTIEVFDEFAHEGTGQ